MIRHIVTLKLNENASFEAIREKILNLKNHLSIKHIEVGFDIGFDKSASDIAIIADFENIQDLKTYANDEIHQKIIKEDIKPYLISRCAVDYEI